MYYIQILSAVVTSITKMVTPIHHILSNKLYMSYDRKGSVK